MFAAEPVVEGSAQVAFVAVGVRLFWVGGFVVVFQPRDVLRRVNADENSATFAAVEEGGDRCDDVRAHQPG